MNHTRSLALLALSALFTACGGGGSGDPSPPAAPAPAAAPGAAPAPASAPNEALIIPLAAILKNLLSQSRSTPFEIKGSMVLQRSMGSEHFYASGSGTLSETVASASFEGVPAMRQTTLLSGSMLGPPTPVAISLTKQLFFDGNYKPLGSVADGIYCVTSSYTPPPKGIGMWTTSMWFMEDCYSGPDKLKKVGTAGTSYTISSETATTAVLWIGRRLSYTDGTYLDYGDGKNVDFETSYSVDTEGHITLQFSNMSRFKVGEAIVTLIPLYKH